MNTIVETNQNSAARKEVSVWRRPQTRTRENTDSFELEVFLPGVDKDAIDLSVKEGILTLTAEPSEVSPSDWKPLYRERTDGGYRLNFKLRRLIKEDAIQAELVDGILKLRLPKADELKARKIELN
jgi:HSP20 family protein